MSESRFLRAHHFIHLFRWCDHFSEFFTVACGVRQGGVLSPYLFAIYVDDIVAKINTSDLGCRIGLKGIAIVLYADDILLLAPSVDSLQKLITIVEQELYNLYYSFYATARRDSVPPNASWAKGPEGCSKSHEGRVDSL